MTKENTSFGSAPGNQSVAGALFVLGASATFAIIGVPVQVRAAIFIGIVGVVLILKPGSELFRPIAFLGIISAMLVATAMVTIRRMSPQEPPQRIVFYFSLIATLISAVPLLWAFQLPRGQTLSMLVLISLFAVAGQLMLTKGYSLAPSARVGPFSYGSVFFLQLSAGLSGMKPWTY